MESAETTNLDRIQRPALAVGAGAFVLCTLGWIFDHDGDFYRSYLWAYLFWFGIVMGSTAILMLQHLTGGTWGLVIRRLLESATRMVPLMMILFIPLLFGMKHLYIWTDAHDAHGTKHGYLTISFFLIRAGIYFLIWLAMTLMLNAWSADQDRTGDPRLARRMQFVSGPGLVVYALTITFAAIDWVMSIDPHWYSTMYGLFFIVGQVLTTIAFSIVIIALLGKRKPLADLLTPGLLQDLGNLLMAFVMLWAYIALSQYLIIWSANIPEETPYYLYRTAGLWKYVALALIIFHFFIPFILLLSRRNKRSIDTLAAVAVGVLVMRMVDLFWTVMPMFQQSGKIPGTGLLLHWLDFFTPLAIGGIWLGVYVWQLKRRPLLPLHDPRLEGVGGHHHG